MFKSHIVMVHSTVYQASVTHTATVQGTIHTMRDKSLLQLRVSVLNIHTQQTYLKCGKKLELNWHWGGWSIGSP